jgi:hypothetical protein
MQAKERDIREGGGMNENQKIRLERRVRNAVTQQLRFVRY